MGDGKSDFYALDTSFHLKKRALFAHLRPSSCSALTLKYNPAPSASANDSQKMKRRIRILRFVSRVISTILSGFMAGSMAFSLERYLNTRNIQVTGVESIWANPTTLWPTIMLLVIAFITFLINFTVLMSYWCSIRAANSVDSFGGKFIYVMLGAQIIVWAVTTGLFKSASNGSDLWGWSCGSPSDEIQPLVESFLDFGQLCMVQVSGAFWGFYLGCWTRN